MSVLPGVDRVDSVGEEIRGIARDDRHVIDLRKRRNKRIHYGQGSARLFGSPEQVAPGCENGAIGAE